MRHDLKTWREFYHPVVMGYKKVELRKADRPYQVGDILVLHEIDKDTGMVTGRSCERMITHIVREGEWLTPGYWALSIGEPKREWCK